MKLKNLVGPRYKERPADCVIDSHALMVRGGYMKYVGNGIFSEFPILRKITQKIETIIREEINAIDGEDVERGGLVAEHFGHVGGSYCDGIRQR